MPRLDGVEQLVYLLSYLRVREILAKPRLCRRSWSISPGFINLILMQISAVRYVTYYLKFQSPFTCKGQAHQDRPCYQPCLPETASWSEWSQCSESCGGGSSVRLMTCQAKVDRKKIDIRLKKNYFYSKTRYKLFFFG